MKNIKETLWADYENVTNTIKNSNKNDEGYKELLEERDKIRNELIKMDQLEQEKELRILQIDSDNKRDKTRNFITISINSISFMISAFSIWKAFEFDKTSTMTSTLGRNIITNSVPKLFKK